MNVRTRVAGVALSVVFGSGVAQAHHSFAQFDMAKTMTLNGTITAWEWTNPHAWVWITVAGANGPEPWGAECQSPNGLVRAGWTKHSFQPGQSVTLTVHPARNGSHAGMFLHAVLADGTELKPVGP